MESFVSIKESVVITPSEPTPSCVLTLSALDSKFQPPTNTRYLFVYKACPGLDQAAISARMKEALAKALVPYYPLAGRLRERPDGSCLEVVCQAQGAMFSEAFSDRYSTSDFEKAPETGNQWMELLSLYTKDVFNGSPPLLVQLTWLNDGAAAVGVGISHAICDGIGGTKFINYFAELASGKSTSITELKLKPVWDRHLLNPSPTKPDQANPTIHPEFNPVPDCGFMTLFSGELKPTSMTFDGKRLNELKSVARSSSQLSEVSYTSFEVLTAHVWRSWARALSFPSNQTLKLFFSINVRNRADLGISEGFYGNAYVLACAETSAKELVQKGLGYASGLVKSAKERVDNDYVRKVIETASESMVTPDTMAALVVSQWSRMGLESVDFGLGKPIHTGPLCYNKYCLFSPVNNKREAVKVTLAIPTFAVDDYQHFLTASQYL